MRRDDDGLIVNSYNKRTFELVKSREQLVKIMQKRMTDHFNFSKSLDTPFIVKRRTK